MQKRCAVRKIKRLPVTFTNNSLEQNGFSSDVSFNGIFIRTRRALNPGNAIQIIVELDCGSRVPMSGVVCRSIRTGTMDIKNGMGVRLTEVHPKYTMFVSSLVGEKQMTA
ncbi:MAG: PilZ domain-containing protein [Nitrospirae bacterium]|nr:PilZ domain-containing protein [Nitrospirota bacterium]